MLPMIISTVPQKMMKKSGCFPLQGLRGTDALQPALSSLSYWGLSLSVMGWRRQENICGLTTEVQTADWTGRDWTVSRLSLGEPDEHVDTWSFSVPCLGGSVSKCWFFSGGSS